MNKLDTIETLISKIPCPVCLNTLFEVQLSCEMANAPCDFHAVCGHCHYRFIVAEESKTMDQVWQGIQDHVRRTGCPKCGDPELSVEFLCDVKSEDCFFLVSCSRHRHFSRLSQDEIRYLFN